MTWVGCDEAIIKGKHMVSFSISSISVFECNFYLVIYRYKKNVIKISYIKKYETDTSQFYLILSLNQ